MRRVLALVLVVLVFLPCAGAADAKLEIELRADAYAGDEPSEQVWIRETLRYTSHLSRRIVFTATTVVERDSHGDLERDHLFDADDRDLRRAPVRFEDLKLLMDLGRVDLEIGRQGLLWGRTDGVKATDNLTPWDWTEPLSVVAVEDEVRLSPWALRAGYEQGRWHAELALVPLYAPSRLPQLGGRWFRLGPATIVNPAFPRLGPPELQLEFAHGDADFPASTFENIQRGARGGYRGSRVEWALSYFRGFDDAALIQGQPGTPDFDAGVLPVMLNRSFPRVDVGGADGVLLLGRWALRAEAGYFHFPDGEDDDYLLYEIEAEWTRGSWRTILGFADFADGNPAEDLLDALQQAISGTGSISDAPTARAVLDQGFVPAVLGHASRGTLTGWELGLEAALGTEHKDYVVRLFGSWPATDAVRFGARLDLINGPEESFFGQWRESDRLELFLRVAI